MRVSCGVVVTDGERLLLGHATGSPRWDIFKGVAEPDEPPALAASRELREETGLQAAPDALIPLGNMPISRKNRSSCSPGIHRHCPIRPV